MARKDIEVVIYDTVVTAMSQPGGMVWKWARQKSQRTGNTARRYCPVHSGRLRSTVNSFYEGSTRDQVKVGVSAGGPGAPYARFVIKGTGWPPGDRQIHAEPGQYFRIKDFGINGRPLVTRNIRGQEPNDFLSRALEEVMATL